jgi:phospholipase C
VPKFSIWRCPLSLGILCSTALAVRAQTISPTSMDFGKLAVGTTVEAIATLTNTQSVPLTISSISASTNFAETSYCPIAPKTLAAAGSCKISVKFTPPSLGSITGALNVNDNSSTSPQVVQLSGQGEYPIVLSPSGEAFGAQLVNNPSTPEVLTLQNFQMAPVTIAGISTSGDFAQTSNCPVAPNTLAQRLTCQISVTFTPTTVGPQDGTLTVTDGTSNSPQSATLRGTGIRTRIQHVIMIVQENRTPDNLFHDPVLIARGADIASSGLNSKGQTITLVPIALANDWDLDHVHIPSFVEMYDNGKMDGANLVALICKPYCPLDPAATQYAYVQASDVAPYFAMAEQYTFGDRMFQSNQGPSFPAHQFIIAGTSAPSVGSDLFAAENPNGGTSPGSDTGCSAPSIQTVALIDPSGDESQTQFPCFEHPTITDLLDNKGLTWRYYTPALGTLWTGPNAIDHIRFGPDWANVITPNSTILTDIRAGTLPDVSWVIPLGQASDHSDTSTGEGPSWVSSIVNAIGNSPYWANTAILITWDDWGGWYDHVAPPILNSYEYGFRVPLVVVSPYAKPAYISHVTHDFSSFLKFIEKNFDLPSLGYGDAVADDLSDCFDFNQTPITFQPINAALGADFFLNDTRAPLDPDDD